MRTEELDVGGGRTLHVPESLKASPSSRSSACAVSPGPADYLAIARRFLMVIMVGIP